MTSYFCDKCGVEYNSPPIPKVTVLSRERGPVFFADYKCGVCGRTVRELMDLDSLDGISQENIVRDETGIYKPPTAKDIDDEISTARKLAEDGRGNRLNQGEYKRRLEQAERWAEVIGHDIPIGTRDELDGIYRTVYIARAQERLPELIMEIKRSAHGFIPDPDGEGHMEGTGLYQLLYGELYDVFPHLDLTKVGIEDRKDILRILEAHKSMFQEISLGLARERDNIQVEIDSGLESADQLGDTIEKYIERAGLGNNDVDDVKENPLSTFPGDNEEDPNDPGF